MKSIAEAETVLALRPDETKVSGVRVIVRHPRARPTSPGILQRRLAIARALVRAHRSGVSAERIRQLDAAYVATRLPLDDGESYDE